MPGYGQIRWKALADAMDALLPGWYYEDKGHGRYVFCKAIRPDSVKLPKGAHGRTNPEVELGHVKKLFRFFGKLPDAKRLIEQL